MVEGQWRDEVPGRGGARSAARPGRCSPAERTALNLLGHLSGVATLTARFVDAVGGTGATILDTRKTTPGLRALEKAAVAAGGGRNHRMGLARRDPDQGEPRRARRRGRRARSSAPRARPVRSCEVEVECRDADEVAEALDAGADRLLLDNMDVDELRAAVARARRAAGAAGGEARGLRRRHARQRRPRSPRPGVEFISVGALTHSAPALDLSMLVELA